jgi:hypothetical protein
MRERRQVEGPGGEENRAAPPIDSALRRDSRTFFCIHRHQFVQQFLCEIFDDFFVCCISIDDMFSIILIIWYFFLRPQATTRTERYTEIKL